MKLEVFRCIEKDSPITFDVGPWKIQFSPHRCGVAFTLSDGRKGVVSGKTQQALEKNLKTLIHTMDLPDGPLPPDAPTSDRETGGFVDDTEALLASTLEQVERGFQTSDVTTQISFGTHVLTLKKYTKKSGDSAGKTDKFWLFRGDDVLTTKKSEIPSKLRQLMTAKDQGIKTHDNKTVDDRTADADDVRAVDPANTEDNAWSSLRLWTVEKIVDTMDRNIQDQVCRLQQWHRTQLVQHLQSSSSDPENVIKSIDSELQQKKQKLAMEQTEWEQDRDTLIRIATKVKSCSSAKE